MVSWRELALTTPLLHHLGKSFDMILFTILCRIGQSGHNLTAGIDITTV